MAAGGKLLVPVIGAAALIGFGAWLFGAEDKPASSGGALAPGGKSEQPGAGAFVPASSMSCDEALARFSKLDPTLHAQVVAILATGSDPAAMRTLALALEQAAGTVPQSWPAENRAAILRVAQCVRDRATAVDVANKVSLSYTAAQEQQMKI